MTTATSIYATNPITPTGAEKMVADNAGGTTGGLLSQAIADLFNGKKGADIASATTTNLAAATGTFVHVTGTTTITGLGTATAGVLRFVVFDGALLLTHNATSLILPTGANITTAAGDAALFVSEGAGNWRAIGYWRKDGTALGGSFTGGSLSSALNEAKGANIASAATTDIGAATGNLVHVTGTTTITALGTIQAGTRRVVVFDGALTLTHNATSLILPTAANITTVAGDVAVFVSEGSGNWKCVGYLRASGAPLDPGFGTGLTANEVGFRNIPQNSQSAAYTLVAADSGKHIYHPSTDANARTFTIPANGSVAFPIGTSVTFINETSQVVSIAITTDTLVLAGTGSTGTRSLAQYGVATAIKVTSTRWLISGTGLT